MKVLVCFTVIITSIGQFLSLSNTAQNRIRPIDTIYYLVDTTQVPIKDRMMITGTEKFYDSYRNSEYTIKYFRFKLKILPYGYYPTFTYRLGQRITKVNKKSLKD